MVTGNPFASMVPGFDFLQGLVKNAGSALPHMGQWVAPTLDPEELDKRIEELRTVQFWLEQNARMLAATIQALEVQRMTLSTLQNMNVSMGELQEAMTLRPTPAPTRPFAAPRAPDPAPEPPAPEPAAPPAEAEQGPAAGARSRKRGATDEAAEDAPGVVDPMQWWGALTKQFTQLATQAVRETGAGPAAWGTPATPPRPRGKAAANAATQASGSASKASKPKARAAGSPGKRASTPARKASASKGR